MNALYSLIVLRNYSLTHFAVDRDWQRVSICCSLSTIANKSPNIVTVMPDTETAMPEDEEKLIPSGDDSES